MVTTYRKLLLASPCSHGFSLKSYHHVNCRGFSSTPSSARPAYFDYQSTTPLDPRVLDAMMPYMTSGYGNPHSRSHAFGWEAEDAVELSREKIADLIGAKPKEIVFTSGATESNNLAIKGLASYLDRTKRNHIVTTQIEHKCVLASCRVLEDRGYEVTYLGVNNDGLVDIEEVRAAVRPSSTALVSVMTINNEIGVVQPIKQIGQLCREMGIYFHTDAAQALGKIALDVNELCVDLMSLSGHKIYGPKGIGALYVGTRRPRVRLHAIVDGGGQERGIRSGTLPTAMCVGFGKACEVAQLEMAYDEEHVTRLGALLLNQITDRLPDVTLNGSKDFRYSGNLNISFAHVEGESLLMSLSGVAVSSGSACTSASLEPSYVLRAIGVGEELAHTSIRFGIGRFTTEDEVKQCVEDVVKHVERLREMSPLWEAAQEERVTGKKTKMVWT